MTPLTLQEVIEKINDNSVSNPRPTGSKQVSDRRHRPEFYVPRIALRIAALKFNGLRFWGLASLTK
jgi:hypothetical protein